jgi:predicted nucleic acid-binding protein
MKLCCSSKIGVAGGRAYDAVIAACAAQGKASTVLTFNAADFTALGQDFEIAVPGTI